MQTVSAIVSHPLHEGKETRAQSVCLFFKSPIEPSRRRRRRRRAAAVVNSLSRRRKMEREGVVEGYNS